MQVMSVEISGEFLEVPAGYSIGILYLKINVVQERTVWNCGCSNTYFTTLLSSSIVYQTIQSTGLNQNNTHRLKIAIIADLIDVHFHFYSPMWVCFPNMQNVCTTTVHKHN